ncbi:MAG TPA: ATP-binding protein [Paracoccaceae bacterium]|nr:ATP-binding protein [Paracoccaceae bacterium]
MTGPRIHLVHGGTGAGKSTLARRIAAEERALAFHLDDWMQALFWVDHPPGSQPMDWALERIERCVGRMWAVAEQAAALGVGAVFDCGFTTRAERDRLAARAEAAGLPVRLHWLDVDAETRWARVETRNAERGETFAFAVTRAMFDFMETIREAPDAAEMAARDGLRH